MSVYDPKRTLLRKRLQASNFNRAESDMYFESGVEQAGGIGKFHHHREVMRIDNQTVIRANRVALAQRNPPTAEAHQERAEGSKPKGAMLRNYRGRSQWPQGSKFIWGMSVHGGVWTMAKKPKFTPAQIKNKVKEIEEVIEQQKRENKGEHFVSLTRKEIEKKLKRANSPFITVQGWSDAHPGGLPGRHC